MKSFKNTISSIALWTYIHKVAIVNVLLWSFFLFQVISFTKLYITFKTSKEFVTRVNPILEEMDTTYSLRNYEVMRVKLYNEVKRWEDGDYDK